MTRSLKKATPKAQSHPKPSKAEQKRIDEEIKRLQLLTLRNRDADAYLELLELDPDGGEAWFDDNDNVPEHGSVLERIKLIEAHIAELKEMNPADDDLGPSPTELRSELI